MSHQNKIWYHIGYIEKAAPQCLWPGPGNKLAAADVYEICICKPVAVNFEYEMNDVAVYSTS